MTELAYICETAALVNALRHMDMRAMLTEAQGFGHIALQRWTW